MPGGAAAGLTGDVAVACWQLPAALARSYSQQRPRGAINEASMNFRFPKCVSILSCFVSVAVRCENKVCRIYRKRFGARIFSVNPRMRLRFLNYLLAADMRQSRLVDSVFVAFHGAA
jgi:hypothetical protein